MISSKLFEYFCINSTKQTETLIVTLTRTNKKTQKRTEINTHLDAKEDYILFHGMDVTDPLSEDGAVATDDRVFGLLHNFGGCGGGGC